MSIVRCTQNQLIEAALLAILPKLLSRMYSPTKFLHTSGYFMKLVQLLGPHILEMLQVRRGAPPADMVVFVRKMVDDISCHRSNLTKLQDRIRDHWVRLDGMDPDSDEDSFSSHARANFKKAAERFVAVWYGLFWERDVCVTTGHTAAQSRGWRF